MKRLLCIFVASILFVGCTKEDSPLVKTQWDVTENFGENHRVTLTLNFDTPSRGNARVYESITGPTSQMSYVSSIYSVKYLFDENDCSGTVTFTKESSTANGWDGPSYMPHYYSDTVVSSFYTYAGNNKMFLFSTPMGWLKSVELTREN